MIQKMKQTILITGTSSGIGKATALLFARNGWNVVATMRDPSKDTELSHLPDVMVTRLDVQDYSSIEDAIKSAIARFGRIDALCNNAGLGLYGLFESVTREKMREQFEVNVFGVMDVIRALLPHFRANQRGTIVNVGSGAGIFALPMSTPYCASKFALEGFTEALSYELASQGVTVKLVTPYSGVNDTAFAARSMQEMARDTSLKQYDTFVAETNNFFGGLVSSESKPVSKEIAQTIWGAVTDGTERLRYLLGGDDTRPFVEARRAMADQDYIEFMRAQIAVKGSVRSDVDFMRTTSE
ncbi:hypothetical protein HWV62_12450 [Athelia sp. TMB]|nr:hypothetical protein HWV62_12450 [Athelia sp. TMB]